MRNYEDECRQAISAISFLGDYIYTYPPTHAYYIIYNMMALGTHGTNYKNLLLWQK